MTGRVTVIAQVPERDAIVTVRRKGEMHEVLFDGRVILTEEAHDTEIAFGRLAAELARGRPDPRVLVGGLGFGYTLRGALDVVGPRARIVVVERVGAIVELCRGVLADLAGRAVQDSRVTIIQGSVQDALREAQQGEDARERRRIHSAGARGSPPSEAPRGAEGAPDGDTALREPGRYDVMLLDVDNGPDWATFRDNTWLYGDAGVAACARALGEDGSVAVWSGYPAPRFLRVLRKAGLQAREIPLPVKGRVRARAYVGSRLIRRSPKD